ncbi:hypothetical protein [Nostoc sp. UHCC 0870]|uniref:hypothetical protein n=1 Tax=Nostoc sp. UHCC 0870 TaxID=2914041 RepID=UPI001EE056CD|nr:hypothetical protein [Nostoc sp. UHCC 0870]UKO95817.1 hypothetical protein L6494_14140 [Nostoc sp. UHCC 0870]
MNNSDFFDDALLEKRIETFYGYGNYLGKYWFIGMEEAGGDFEDVKHRINIWAERKEKELDDLAEYHIAMGCAAGFEEGAKLSVPVWRAIMRMVLSAKGQENITVEDIRKYQISELGRKDKETCLLELLPLPSPSRKHWIYGKHCNLPFLANRKNYEDYCIDMRINHISQKIKEQKPELVVFYGREFDDFWKEITNNINPIEFTKPSSSYLEDFLVTRNSQTVFVIAKFPRALPNEYFHSIGRAIAAKL